MNYQKKKDHIMTNLRQAEEGGGAASIKQMGKSLCNAFRAKQFGGAATEDYSHAFRRSSSTSEFVTTYPATGRSSAVQVGR